MSSDLPTDAPGIVEAAQPPPLPPPILQALPPPPPLRGLSIARAIGLAALLVGLQLVLGMVAAIFDRIAKPAQSSEGLAIISISLASSAILLVFALRKKSASWREALPFTRFSGRLLPPMLIAVAGLSILVSESNNTLQWFMPLPIWLIHMMEIAFGGRLATVIALVVVPPLAEETVFRGVILGGLLRRYRARTAILVSAGLFMLVHVNPYQFAIAFTIGILAGWIYVQTRSLWPCMIVHGLFNLGPVLVAIGAFPWEIEGYWKRLDMDLVLFQPLWFDALGAALAGLGLLWLHGTFRRHSAPSPQVNA